MVSGVRDGPGGVTAAALGRRRTGVAGDGVHGPRPMGPSSGPPLAVSESTNPFRPFEALDVVGRAARIEPVRGLPRGALLPTPPVVPGRLLGLSVPVGNDDGERTTCGAGRAASQSPQVSGCKIQIFKK